MATRCVPGLLLLLLLLLPGFARAALNDGLTAYYPFNGNANDASGNGRNGTPLGGVGFTGGIAGEAARFDGSTGHVQLGDASVGNFSANATIAFWFNADASNFLSGQHRIVEKDAGAGAYWIFGLTDAGLVVTLRGANLSGPPQAEFVLTNKEDFTGVWTAIALRKAASTFELFVNGQSAGTRDTAIGTVVPNEVMNFGHSLSTNSQFYAGMIDEARLYDRALDSLEIAQLADASLPSIPEPQTYALMLAGIGLVAYAVVRRRRLASRQG